MDLEFVIDDLVKAGQILDQLNATPCGTFNSGNVIIEVSDALKRHNYFRQSKFFKAEPIVLSQKSTNVCLKSNRK